MTLGAYQFLLNARNLKTSPANSRLVSHLATLLHIAETRINDVPAVVASHNINKLISAASKAAFKKF